MEDEERQVVEVETGESLKRYTDAGILLLSQYALPWARQRMAQARQEPRSGEMVKQLETAIALAERRLAARKAH